MSLGAAVLTVILVTVTGCAAAIVWLLVEAHRERWQWDARAAAAERMIEANRAPKHAASSPRTDLTRNREDRMRMGDGLAGPSPAVPRSPWYVTAADLKPVIVPTPMNAPRQHLDAGTETFERVPTDTGELRALTDEWIHKTRAEGEQWRRENAL